MSKNLGVSKVFINEDALRTRNKIKVHRDPHYKRSFYLSDPLPDGNNVSNRGCSKNWKVSSVGRERNRSDSYLGTLYASLL